MKIGIQTNSFDKGYGRWGEDTYKKLREHGYSCSDFNMCDTTSIIYTAPRKEAEKLMLHEKEKALQAGIEISQVHGPWRWPPEDVTEENRAERMDKMKESIRLTALLGCENWVVHPVMPYGVNEIFSDNAKRTWDINHAFMDKLLKTAKEYNITICLENMPMPEFSMATPENILKFVKEVNDEHFKICFDTGHVSVFDDLNIEKEVERLSKEIKVLHVHDNKFGMDLHMMPTMGIIDWTAFANALKNISFDGCFSLETMPPTKLSNDIFEDMCKLLFRIANEIIN